MSSQSEAKAEAMAKDTQATFPVLSDETLTAIRAYGIEDVENGIAWPSIFVIGSDGRICWRSLSDKVSERATAADVVAAVAGCAN